MKHRSHVALFEQVRHLPNGAPAIRWRAVVTTPSGRQHERLYDGAQQPTEMQVRIDWKNDRKTFKQLKS